MNVYNEESKEMSDIRLGEIRLRDVRLKDIRLGEC